MKSSSLPCYLVPLKCKYLPQHPIRQIYNFTTDQHNITSHLFQIRVLFINNFVTEHYTTDMIHHHHPPWVRSTDLFWHRRIALPRMSPPGRGGGGLVGPNDLRGYAGRNFMFLVGPPKLDRP